MASRQPRRRRSWPAVLVLLLAASSLRAAAGERHALRIDDAHSHAEFSVRLLWLRQIAGRFSGVHGGLQWSDDDRRGVVDAWIDVASVHMPQARYEHWLLAPEFFDVAHYPRIHFVSAPTPVRRLAHGGPLHGRLSMRGVTRPVTLQILPSDCLRPGVAPCTLRLRGTVRRSHFGMRGHGIVLSDRVQLGLLITLRPSPQSP